MADSPAPKSAPTSEELHRGILHLREDIRDLRNQIGGIHHRIDETNRSLGGRIDETNRSLGGRIDETNRSLGERIDETNRSLGERIDETNRSLGQKIDETNRSLNAYFRWTIATLVAMTGILSAVIKL